MAQGQPVLPAPGPLYDTAVAERFRAGQRPFGPCTWCGTRTMLCLEGARLVVCARCDKAPAG